MKTFVSSWKVDGNDSVFRMTSYLAAKTAQTWTPYGKKVDQKLHGDKPWKRNWRLLSWPRTQWQRKSPKQTELARFCNIIVLCANPGHEENNQPKLYTSYNAWVNCANQNQVYMNTYGLLCIEAMWCYDVHIAHWISGTQHGYHGITFGLYVDQLVRRVDPYKRDLSTFFHQEIAVPFGKYYDIAIAYILVTPWGWF